MPMSLLLVFHVVANLVWIGSSVATALLAARAATLGDGGKALAEAAHELLYRRVSSPAFYASFLCGAGIVAMSADTYMHAHWFHGKLFFALCTIAVHHIIGARARKVHAGGMQAGKSGGILSGVLLACAFATVLFVVLKSSLVK
jgi:putative membrane protein